MDNTAKAFISLEFEELEVVLQSISAHHQLCCVCGDVKSANKAAEISHKLMPFYRALKQSKDYENEARSVEIGEVKS